MTSSSNGLDLKLLTDVFQESQTGDDGAQILLDKYILGFQEIARFFEMMGTLFGFISRDIHDKRRILGEHLKEKPDQFTTIQSMVKYELENNLTQAKTASGLVSGSRTLLRLHRALQFFAQFLRKIEETENDDTKCSDIASAVYSETLGKFHPWLIRQAAYLAMRSLPTKQKLIKDCIKQSREEAEVMVGPLVNTMQTVYDITQELYSEKNLLHLP